MPPRRTGESDARCGVGAVADLRPCVQADDVGQGGDDLLGLLA
jgi:hypothetical protein